MGKLFELRDKLRQLSPSRMEDEVLGIIKNNENVATNLNTDQLFSGEDSTGAKLPEYSATSVNVFNKPAGPYRLFDTGDFYKGFFVRTDKFPVVFGSTDRKTDKLTRELGYGIFGLQKQNLKEFSRSYVLEDIKAFLFKFLRV